MEKLSVALKYKYWQNPNRVHNEITPTTSPISHQSPLVSPPWQQQGFPSNSNDTLRQQQGFSSNRNHPQRQQQGFPSNSNHPHGYPSAALTSPDYVEQQRPNENPNHSVSQHSDYKTNGLLN